MKISIKGTNIDLTPALKEYATENINTLDKFHNNIIEARIELEKTTNHHQKGEIYRAEVNLKVPGDLIRVEKTAEDINSAVEMAKDALKKTLRRHKEKEQERNKKVSL